MRTIDLLVGDELGGSLGPRLARHGPLPVRVIQRVGDVVPDALLVVSPGECSVADCRRLSADGVDVVVLTESPRAVEERDYLSAGAAAYVALIVDELVSERLLGVLETLAG